MKSTMTFMESPPFLTGFLKIAAHEGCTAIIGVDAHNNQYLENPFYSRANRNTPEAGYKGYRQNTFLQRKIIFVITVAPTL